MGEFGPFRPEEAEALNAFDLFVPPKPITRATAFLAKLKPAKETTPLATGAGQPSNLQSPRDTPNVAETRTAPDAPAPALTRADLGLARPGDTRNPATSAPSPSRVAKLQGSPSQKDGAPPTSPLASDAQAATPHRLG